MGSFRVTIEWENGAAWVDGPTPAEGMGRVYQALDAATAVLRGAARRPVAPLTRAGTLPVITDPELARALADRFAVPRDPDETPRIYVDDGCLEVETWYRRCMPPQPEWTEAWLREHVDDAIASLLEQDEEDA